jgi:predicted nucleotidyltransferase component of viral defense system
MHPYTNMPDDGFEVVADNYIEAFAEKFRALAGRTRPRDLSDVVKFQRRYVMPRRNVVNCLWTKAFGQFCRSHGDHPVSWSVLGA